MERFKRKVDKIVAEDNKHPPTMVSISLETLRTLQAIAGQAVGIVRPESRRAKALAEAGEVYSAAFMAEHNGRDEHPSILPDVIRPDMSGISLGIAAPELKERFARGEQTLVLLDIRSKLMNDDILHWKKAYRQKLIAEIDKVL
jgi:hypothetical protein